MDSIDLVIPTYNRAAIIFRTLKKIDMQYFNRVIVVDDGSSSEQMEDISGLPELYHNLTIMYNKFNKGASLCRAQGMKASKARYVLFSDDDIWFDNEFCDALFEKLKSADKAVIAGGITKIVAAKEESSAPSDAVDVCYNDWFCKIRLTKYNSTKLKLPFVWNPMLIDRNFYVSNEIPFYPYRGNGYREESDHQICAFASGGVVVFQPLAIAYHLGSQNEGGAWGSGTRVNRICKWYFWSVVNDWIFFKRNTCHLNEINEMKKPFVLRFVLSAFRNLVVFRGIFRARLN